jgi:hypothetical protein
MMAIIIIGSVRQTVSDEQANAKLNRARLHQPYVVQ